MDVSELGINPDNGGASLVVAGTIVDHRSYQGKDGKTRYPTTVLYFGGNLTLNLDPDHPIKKMGVGEEVLFSQPMLEDRFGWKQTGTPTLIDRATKPKTKTPPSA